jgi:Ca2+-binding RTX toxin-like protein
MRRRTSRAALGLIGACACALALTAGPAAAADGTTAAGAELPSCAEGPERVGDEILGTACADHIVAPASVTTVDAGPGDDVIVGANSAPVPAALGSPATGLHLEVGSQTFNGEGGDDIVYGDRGNDTLRGGGGNDRLYGGIGDDVLEGGEGDDFLFGGFGSDKIDGQTGNDFVRGDATIDHIFDSGGGFDTLSFATGMPPGFTGALPSAVSNFPPVGGERGVLVELGNGGVNALQGEPSLGGGNDEVQAGVFERIVGSPFSDYIVGTSAAEQIYGGGGADVIKGGGGADQISGGADGDFIEAPGAVAVLGEGGTDRCIGVANPGCESETGAPEVTPRDTSKVSVGETSVPAPDASTQVYLVGSTGSNAITAEYGGTFVNLTIAPGTFNADAGGCTLNSGQSATCPLPSSLDTLALAGMGGDDTIVAGNFPDSVSVVASGGSGSDHLVGGPSEDTLIDGEDEGADLLEAAANDDALTHNGGPDRLDGGEGSDLFLSVSICDGETLNGGIERQGAPVPDRDNASWARFHGEGVDARLDLSTVGRVGGGELPECGGEAPDHMEQVEDLEGSSQSDVLYGNQFNNQLLGHQGADAYFAGEGDDAILANSGTVDRVINCGPGNDQAVIDLKSVAVDPTPIECERVREGAVEEFNELPLLSEPPPPPPVKPKPKPDRTPPRSKLLHHPAKTLHVQKGRRKALAFRFASSEAGSSFKCKLDRKPYANCKSPRKYRVPVGRHVFRLFAIDRAGNRDKTPAVFQFRVVAVRSHR